MNKGGVMKVDNLERRCKIVWNVPSALVADKLVAAVAEELALTGTRTMHSHCGHCRNHAMGVTMLIIPHETRFNVAIRKRLK